MSISICKTTTTFKATPIILTPKLISLNSIDMHYNMCDYFAQNAISCRRISALFDPSDDGSIPIRRMKLRNV